MKLKMSKKRAYLTGFLHLVILNSRYGFRCTLDAARQQPFKDNKFLENVVSVKIDGEIIWVSMNEFRDNNLKEEENIPFEKHEILSKV